MHKFISFLVLLHIACSNCILLSRQKTPPLRCSTDEILLPTTDRTCSGPCSCDHITASASRICVPTNYYFQGDLRYSEIHSIATPSSKSGCCHEELTHTFIPGQKTWHPSLPPPTPKSFGYYCNQPIEVFNPESTTQLLFTPLVNTPQSPPSTKFVTAKQNTCNCVEKCSCSQSGSRASITTRTVPYTQSVTTVTVAPTSNASSAIASNGCNICAQTSPRTVVLYARSLNNPYQSPTWEPVVMDQSNQNIVYHCDDDVQYINSYQSSSCNAAPISDDTQSDSVVTITITNPSQYFTTNEPTCYYEDNVVTVTATENTNSISTVYPTSSICSATANSTTATSSASTVTVTVSNCSCSACNPTTGPITSTEGPNSTSCIVPPTGTVCVPLATLIKYNVSLVRVDDIPMDIVFNSTTTSPNSTSTAQTLTVAQVCNGTTSIINTTTVSPSSNNISSCSSTTSNISTSSLSSTQSSSTTTTSTASTITSNSSTSTCSNSPTSTVSNTTCSHASSTVTQVVVTTVYPSNHTSTTYNNTSITTTSQPKYCGVSNSSSSQMIIVTNSAGQPVSRMNISVSEPIQCNTYLVVTWDPSTIPSDAKYLDFYMRQGFAGKAVQVLSNYSLTKSNKEKAHVAIYVWNNPDLPSGSGYILQARAKNATSNENGVDLAVGWSQVFTLPNCQSQTITNTVSSQCSTSTAMPSTNCSYGAVKRKSCKPQSTVLYYGGTSPSNSKIVYVQN